MKYLLFNIVIGMVIAGPPTNKYVAISVAGFPEMMLTATNGKLRVKNISATTFRPYDINVCQIKPSNTGYRVQFMDGFLSFKFPSQVDILRSNSPTPETEFNIEGSRDSYNIMHQGLCLQITTKISESSGYYLGMFPCDDEVVSQYFDIREVKMDESEMARSGMLFGYIPRAIRKKRFYGS